MKLNYAWLLAVPLLAAVGAAPARANLVTDPGFESCPTDAPPPPGWSGTADCQMDPHSGAWAATLPDSTLSQSIPTTVGDTYDFSFWLLIAALTPSDFTASFGTDEVLHLTDAPSSDYTFEDFTVSAASASTIIDFVGSSGAGGTWLVDDVSVTAITPAVPEPASLAILATAVIGLATLRRRRSSPCP